MEKRQEETARLCVREMLLEKLKGFTLLSDVFLSVALRDQAACQHVLRLLTGKEDLTVREVRTQYRISKILSHDAILDVLAEDEEYDDGLHVVYVNAEVDDGSETAALMRYFKISDPEDKSQGALSERVHFLKCEKEGIEVMCEITEEIYEIGEKRRKERRKRRRPGRGQRRRPGRRSRGRPGRRDTPWEDRDSEKSGPEYGGKRGGGRGDRGDHRGERGNRAAVAGEEYGTEESRHGFASLTACFRENVGGSKGVFHGKFPFG